MITVVHDVGIVQKTILLQLNEKQIMVHTLLTSKLATTAATRSSTDWSVRNRLR